MLLWLAGLTKLIHAGSEASKKNLMPDYLTCVMYRPSYPNTTEAVNGGLWLEPLNGEGRGNVG